MMKKRSLLSLLLVLALLLPLASASAATYYYVSGTSSLKIRELPDANARVKDSYRADFAVVSYKKYDTNWAYVHFSDGAEGYVMRRYLKSSSSSTAYVKADETPLRAGPAASFSKTADLAQGDKVKVLTQGSVWSYISAPGGTGYVRRSQLSAKYVKKSPNAGTPYAAWVSNPNGNSVNVRRGPGKGYAVDGELVPGTPVTVEKVEGNWSLITGPVSGYMMSRYLSRTTVTPAPGTTPTPKPSSSGKVRYITSPNGKAVNMRHGPSEKGYAVRATLEVGSAVTVVSSEKGWSKIKAGVVTGYVRNEFLTSVKPGTTATPKPGTTPVPPKPAFKSFTGTIVSSNGKAVNLRRDAGTGYATVTQIQPGEKVKVTDEKGNWYKVTYGGSTGYVKKEFIKK